MKYDVVINGKNRAVEHITPADHGSQIAAVIEGRSLAADAVLVAPGVYSVLLDGRSIEVIVEEIPGALLLHAAGLDFRLEIRDPRSWRARHGGKIELEGRQQVTVPMPGKIVQVLVAPGEKVESGQGIMVIEAMKMQNEIRSPKSGIVEQLRGKEGQTVSAGEIVAVIG